MGFGGVIVIPRWIVHVPSLIRNRCKMKCAMCVLKTTDLINFRFSLFISVFLRRRPKIKTKMTHKENDTRLLDSGGNFPKENKRDECLDE